ncbi:unnamed protein product [Symbiodinium sp. KB8]|nr:unnamed protein product [Symbiodinium sp. KB8]
MPRCPRGAAAGADSLGAMTELLLRLRSSEPTVREQMLQEESEKGLKAICAGLGLKRISGSQEELLERIEEALLEEDAFYQSDSPVLRIIEVMGGLSDASRAAGFLADKYRAVDLKGFCKALWLPVSGTKAQMAERIAAKASELSKVLRAKRAGLGAAPSSNSHGAQVRGAELGAEDSTGAPRPGGDIFEPTDAEVMDAEEVEQSQVAPSGAMAKHAEAFEEISRLPGLVHVKVTDREEPYAVPASLLTLSSDVWRCELTGGFMEGETKELPLDVTAGEFEVVLDFLLPAAASKRAVDATNLELLMTLSWKYDLQGLKLKCMNFIGNEVISAHNVERRLYYGIKYQESADKNFFKTDLGKSKDFLAAKFFEVDGRACLRRVRKRIQEEAAKISAATSPLTDLYADVVEDVLHAVRTRGLAAVASYNNTGTGQLRRRIEVEMPHVHKFLKRSEDS